MIEVAGYVAKHMQPFPSSYSLP